ncbi:MAG: ATP-binding protein [Bdellovibrionales bacterium]|nr:ATP-binding protein [Bdellovibrionales bacterium]
MANKVTEENFEWEYEPHLVTDQLGREKYSKPVTALLELISNSFDAKAERIDINLHENQLGGIEKVSVSDNGLGISPEVFNERFKKVGVKPNSYGVGQFGRFGLGRFSVFKLGSRSEWSSVAKNGSSYVELSFSMVEDHSQRLVRTSTTTKTKTGTIVEIFNLYEDVLKKLSPSQLKNEIMLGFLVYLLAHPKKSIFLNGEKLSADDLIDKNELVEDELEIDGDKVKVSIRHILTKRSLSKEKLLNNFLFFGDGKLCRSQKVESRCPANYLALVDSPHISQLLQSNRESIAEMDAGFNSIVEWACSKIDQYQEEIKLSSARSFLEEARGQEFYPYPSSYISPQGAAKQAIYDVALEKIDEHIDLGKLPKKTQAVIFNLLNRAMSNSNILEVLSEVAKLSDEDFDKFRRVLEKTTLEQIIRLGDEVTRRLEFLNSLHEIIYGDISKKIAERKHLHKILEQHCWIFGEQYQLTTSDKSFRTIISKQRENSGLPKSDDESLKNIKEYKLIPDLFMTATRSFPIDPKNHNLIVELKAPAVNLTSVEVAQIKKYANVVRTAPELSQISAAWELFLVSSDLNDDVEAERTQQNRPVGLIFEQANLKVWVFKWSELIQKKKDEMQLVRDHLKMKTDELAVSEDLKKEFPFLNEANV